jgi:threonylcarbamoyladenosine tRNA methylthiotransferase MtaB
MKRRLTAAVVSHGCKLNQCEGDSIACSLERRGFRVLPPRENSQSGSDPHPDVIVVNTCTVTDRSDRKSRHAILRASRNLRPGGLLIVTGCYAQTDPEALRSLDPFCLVVGQDEKHRIPDLVDAHFRKPQQAMEEEGDVFDYPLPTTSWRCRAFVKVQDGCNRSCSYCKVPLARGASKSMNPVKIVSALQQACERGYREAVLTGVNLGIYRYEGLSLAGLLDTLLQRTPEELRIRLSSIEPDCIDRHLLDNIGHPRIMPHFHIPLQSGSDAVLSSMARPYSVSQYLSVIEKIRRVRGNCHIATDIIAGFPGERDADFRHTLETVHAAAFASLHVFRFSARRGTAAARMAESVPPSVKAERSRKLIELGRDLNYRFRRSFQGSVRQAILEPHGMKYVGITDNYIRVEISDGEGLEERTCRRVHIVSATEEGTFGEVI